MPIRRKKNETKNEFVSRCIAQEVKSGKSQEQAAAICYNIWEDRQLAAIKRIRSKSKKELQFEKTRVYVDSSNVDRVMYNDETQELVVRFNDGSTYTYSNVSEDLFEKIIDGVDSPKTSGSNRYGSWRAGVGNSVGATVYKRLVERGVPYKKGGSFR